MVRNSKGYPNAPHYFRAQKAQPERAGQGTRQSAFGAFDRRGAKNRARAAASDDSERQAASLNVALANGGKLEKSTDERRYIVIDL